MAWRGLHISRPSRLSLADGQIVVAQDSDEARLAVEDIAWIVIDAPQVTLSAALLSACMRAGVGVTVTDEFHTPCGMALPFHRHYRQGDVARQQVAMSQSLKGRLWRDIVRRKLLNQAAALDRVGRTGGRAVAAMAARVKPDDPDNIEARGARDYFHALFDRFRRGDDGDRRNAMLNYGYAIVRSAVARSLTASGLLPALGIKHASATNAFNLADDLVEPFRPFVDLAVFEMTRDETTEAAKTGPLDIAHRRQLSTLPLRSAMVGRERLTLLAAADRAAETLVRAIDAATPDALELPELEAAPDPPAAP